MHYAFLPKISVSQGFVEIMFACSQIVIFFIKAKELLTILIIFTDIKSILENQLQLIKSNQVLQPDPSTATDKIGDFLHVSR